MLRLKQHRVMDICTAEYTALEGKKKKSEEKNADRTYQHNVQLHSHWHEL